jgi:hypothetical protein
MITFFEANQARLVTKMNFFYHSWYKGCSVVTGNSGYTVLVGVSSMDESIRSIIPNNIKGVQINLKVE